MKYNVCIAVGASLVGALSVQGADVWSEDFSGDVAVKNSFLESLGGAADNDKHRTLEFGQWIASAKETGNGSVAGEYMEIKSGSAVRGAGVILDPALFGGVAGNYQLEYAMTTFEMNQPGAMVMVDIVAGSDYNLSADRPRLSARLALDVGEPAGERLGLRVHNSGSKITVLAQETYRKETPIQLQTLTFEYDGSSAVALIFGADQGARARIDNLKIVALP
jgi:hypothetical protein